MTHNVQLYPTKEMMAIVQKSGSIVPEKKKTILRVAESMEN